MSTSTTPSDTAVRGDAIAELFRMHPPPRLQSIDVFPRLGDVHDAGGRCFSSARSRATYLPVGCEYFVLSLESCALARHVAARLDTTRVQFLGRHGACLFDRKQTTTWPIATRLDRPCRLAQHRAGTAGRLLRSLNKPQTNWTFEDTLSQIGLGYFPLVVIALAPRIVTALPLQ